MYEVFLVVCVQVTDPGWYRYKPTDEIRHSVAWSCSLRENRGCTPAAGCEKFIWLLVYAFIFYYIYTAIQMFGVGKIFKYL